MEVSDFYLRYPLFHYLSMFWVPLSIIILAVLYTFSPSAKGAVKAPAVTVGGYFVPSFYSRLSFSYNAPAIISKGYKKYKDTAFKCLTPDDELIVLPTKYCEELKGLPYTKLNALEALFTFTENVGEYTAILEGTHLHTEAIQKRFTPAIPRIVPGMIRELDHAFEADFPDCTDWVPIKTFPLLLRLVARAGSRPWVGEALCRNEIWLDASINFMMNLYKTFAWLRAFPKFLRPMVSRLTPGVNELQQQLRNVKDLIIPVVNQRRVAENSQDPDYQKPDDYLQYMMDLAQSKEEAEPGNLAHRLLGLMSMALVPTSAMTATHTLYDLIIMPEYIEPLRAEVSENLPDNWESSTQKDLLALKLLDSFMKESQRLNPLGHVSFHRIVKQTMILSDGLELPAGTHICMPSGPVGVDEDILQNADKFDGFRWLREEKGAASFVSTGPTNLHFGLGRYACPGRYFAAYSIKAIISRLLLDYDFKFGDTQHGRPKNTTIGVRNMPNIQAEIWFRKRQAGSTR